jgi:hypothetical protein
MSNYSLLDQSQTMSATTGVVEPPTCQGAVFYEGDGSYIVKGMIQTNTANAKLLFWAANPATRGYSASGSGMPYPSPEMAFEDTPNRGVVPIRGNYFEFRLHLPNAFYVGLGTHYIAPCVFVKVCENGSDGKIHKISISTGIPYRTLDHPAQRYEKQQMFYHGRDSLPQRTQEQILRDSAYPEASKGVYRTPSNFWGKSIPQ